MRSLLTLALLLAFALLGADAIFKPGVCLCNGELPGMPARCAFFCDTDKGITVYDRASKPGNRSCTPIKKGERCEDVCTCAGADDCHCCEDVPKRDLGCGGDPHDDDDNDGGEWGFANALRAFVDKDKGHHKKRARFCCKDAL